LNFCCVNDFIISVKEHKYFGHVTDTFYDS